MIYIYIYHFFVYRTHSILINGIYNHFIRTCKKLLYSIIEKRWFPCSKRKQICEKRFFQCYLWVPYLFQHLQAIRFQLLIFLIAILAFLNMIRLGRRIWVYRNRQTPSDFCPCRYSAILSSGNGRRICACRFRVSNINLH